MDQHITHDLAQAENLQNTILIVDDEAVNIRLLLEVLQQDYRVVVATSGEQALKLLHKDNNIGLVLLDVDMPGMSGFEVLLNIRQSPSHSQLPIILITSRNKPGDEAFGLDQGANDYISKPISAAIVKARVKTQLTLAHAKTNLQNNNQNLKRALKKAEHATNELTQFTSMISHELRTPITVLKCEIELLVEGVRPPNQTHLDSLLEEVNHFSGLINDMFELVLSDARKLKYKKECVQLDKVVTRSIELFESQFRQRNISITSNCILNGNVNITNRSKASQDMSVFIDPLRMKQVVDNILKNSLKYTDPMGELRVTYEMENDFIVIHFQDSSPGVQKEQLLKLFDRFFRVEKSRNRSTGGAGLGLSICRTIVKDHSGKISAQHSPLGGIWISVALPKHQALVDANQEHTY